MNNKNSNSRCVSPGLGLVDKIVVTTKGGLVGADSRLFSQLEGHKRIRGTITSSSLRL